MKKNSTVPPYHSYPPAKGPVIPAAPQRVQHEHHHCYGAGRDMTSVGGDPVPAGQAAGGGIGGGLNFGAGEPVLTVYITPAYGLLTDALRGTFLHGMLSVNKQQARALAAILTQYADAPGEPFHAAVMPAGGSGGKP